MKSRSLRNITTTDGSKASSIPKVSIAKIIGEIGAACSASTETFLNTLHGIGHKLDEEQLAAIIVCTLSRAMIDNEEKKSTVVDASGASTSIITWNLEVIAEVLYQECRGFNWTIVIKSFDHPLLTIRSESDYLLLVRFFIRISGCSIPAAGLLSHTWMNRSAQFAMLTLSAGAARNIIDFSPLITAEQLLTGEGIAIPPNLSWLCLHLYSRFFVLASNGMPGEVMDVLTKSAAVYPEYFLISLSQVQDSTNSGIRSELLRRLLPLFTGLQGSKPTYISVMRKLHTVNSDILILLCRIAFKKAKKLWEVVNIDNLLTSLGIPITRRLEEEGTADELLSYYCVKADKSDLTLEDKVVALLESNPKNARVFINFAKSHVDNLRPRSAMQSDSILSFENFAVLLKAVQSYPSVVPIEELRALAAVYTQQLQNLQLHQQQLLLQQQLQQQQQQQLQQQQQAGSNQSTSANSNSSLEPNISVSTSLESNLSDATELARLPPGPETDEIESIANTYFQRIYTADLSIIDVITILRQFKASTEKKEQEIFRCMIYNLFDEYRFFHKYPEKELQVTGRLFGVLIQHQLVSSITLGIALRYILEALRKDPDQGESNDKMYRFGRLALEQFRSRLSEWPQYCSHLIQIPHLGRHNQDLFQEAQRALASPQQSTPPTPVLPMNSINLGSSVNLISTQQQQQLPYSFNDLSNLSSLVLSSQSFGNSGPNSTSDPTLSNSNNVSIGSIGALTQQLGTIGLSNSNIINNQNNIIPPSASLATSFVSASMNGGGTVGVVGGVSRLLPSVQLPSSITQNITTPTSSLDNTPPPPPVSQGDSGNNNQRAKTSEIVRMGYVNVDVLNTTMPAESVRDQIHFIVNNIARNNLDAKTNEIRSILRPEYYNWFANYLVVKRISTQPNLHSLYLTVLDSLDFNPLVKSVLDSVYHNVTKLLQSSNITTSSSERSLLRNLGVWLGQMTLAKNRPLLQRRINLKELLFWGFETGRLIAVCSFVAKIVEGVKESKVFKPPNPWLMSILRIMKELYEIEDLKLNIKFEVQVLCRNINIKIEDIPKGNELSKCKLPVKDQKNTDFNFKSTTSGSSSSTSSASPIVTQQSPIMSPLNSRNVVEQRQSSAMDLLPSLPSSQPVRDSQLMMMASSSSDPGRGASIGILTIEQQLQSVLASLATSVIINPALQYFVNNPSQRRFVGLALERAIKEILQSAVERSATIAAATTKVLLLKDFSTEPQEQHLRDGAHLMVSSLSGSLALATCKEPLRVAIGNHLRTLLAQSIPDQTTIEQIVQVVSNDNVDIGAMLIEKAAVEKSVREIDEMFQPAYQLRRANRDTTGQFIDITGISPGTSRYIQELPEPLKPRMGGLSPQQLRVYEAFQRPRMSTSLSSDALTDSKMMGSTGTAIVANLNMSNAIETYQMVLSRIDAALRTLHAQLQGREITISMLGSDNDILLLLRDLITVTQRTQPNVRNETAMTFSENIFNRMFDSISNPDSLRLEVFVAILEAIRDACGGAKFFSPDFISWLGKYAGVVSNDETARKVYRLILILLVRAKLIRCPDIDAYFVMYIEGGRNLFWLELALSFIRQCLVEGMGTIFEFGGTFEAVTKMRPTNAVLKKQLQKWLTDIKDLATAQDEQNSTEQQQQQQQQQQKVGMINNSNSTTASSIVNATINPRDLAVRENVTSLLERWLKVWNTINDQSFGNFVILIEQCGVLKTEETADRFFRISCEICIEACLRSIVNTTENNLLSSTGVGTLNFTVIDALSKLFLQLIRYADKETANVNARVNLLSRILNAIARMVLDEQELKKINSKAVFDQRPYYRLIANMSHDLGVPDTKIEPNINMFPLLAAYTQVFLALQPTAVPSFALSWLQLISRRSFMPNLLLFKGQKGWPLMHRLISSLLLFLQPFLKLGQLPDQVKKLYKGTLRVLLILLHDFPEFLSDYHLSFCELIPINCVQLRNMILSAFPRNMRLPDPYSPNLKIDNIAESSQAPRILSDYMNPLSGIRTHLDNYMTHKQPVELPSKLPAILTNSVGGNYNTALITSLVVYIGSMAIVQIQSNKATLNTSPAMDIYRQMSISLDAEGRYIVLNTMANQLRYPNSHTNFFSFVLLNLFMETDNEFIQEQITRVLLERLIVHRPHPVSYSYIIHDSSMLSIYYYSYIDSCYSCDCKFVSDDVDDIR